MKSVFCLMIILLLSFGQSPGAENSPDIPAATWVVIVSGINKDPEEMQMKSQAVIRLQQVLTQKMSVSKENLFVLLSKDSFAYKSGMQESTSENLLNTLKKLRDTVKPQDTFIFYFTGQANLVKDKLRLNLPGPDMCHDILAEYLNAIPAKRSLVVLDCPAAGYAAESLTMSNRVLIMGAHVNQPWSTRFSFYFVPAMSNEEADYNHDNQISVLEVFRYAAMQLDDYYRERELIKTENPLLEDNGDAVASQQPWTYEQDKKDGQFASQWILCKTVH